jgi:hypothetical protein
MLTAFWWQQWLHKCASMLYIHCLFFELLCLLCFQLQMKIVSVQLFFFFSVTFDSLSFYFHFVLEFLDYFMILKASWNMVWWGSQSENFTLTCEYSNVSQVTLISRLIQWQCCRHGFRKYLVSILLRPILNHVCCSFLDSVKFLAYPLKIGMISLVAHPYVLNFCSWNHVIV